MYGSRLLGHTVVNHNIFNFWANGCFPKCIMTHWIISVTDCKQIGLFPKIYNIANVQNYY